MLPMAAYYYNESRRSHFYVCKECCKTQGKRRYRNRGQSVSSLLALWGKTRIPEDMEEHWDIRDWRPEIKTPPPGDPSEGA
jgi:hypothetical protein